MYYPIMKNSFKIWILWLVLGIARGDQIALEIEGDQVGVLYNNSAQFESLVVSYTAAAKLDQEPPPDDVDSPQNQLVVTDLIPGIGYNFFFISDNQNITKSFYTQPMEVTDPSFKKTSTEIAISWERPGGIRHHYEISYKAVDDKEGATASFETEVEEYTMTNLIAGAMYEINITAISGNSRSEVHRNWESTEQVSIELLERNSSSLKIEWNTPSGDYAQQIVRIAEEEKRDNGIKEERMIDVQGETQEIFTQLEPGLLYHLSVYTVSGTSETEILAAENTFYTAPEMVSSVEVLEVTHNSILLEWVPPTNQPHHYQISYTLNGEDMQVSIQSQPEEPSIRMEPLYPGQHHNIAIVAVTSPDGSGAGASSLPAYKGVKTEEIEIWIVSKVTSGNGFKVGWEPFLPDPPIESNPNIAQQGIMLIPEDDKPRNKDDDRTEEEVYPLVPGKPYRLEFYLVNQYYSFGNNFKWSLSDTDKVKVGQIDLFLDPLPVEKIEVTYLNTTEIGLKLTLETAGGTETEWDYIFIEYTNGESLETKSEKITSLLFTLDDLEPGTRYNASIVTYSNDVASEAITAVLQTVCSGDDKCLNECGSLSAVSQTGGTIYSTMPWSAANAYTAGVTCEWSIRVESGNYVQLEFVSFDVNEGDCVEIYNGLDIIPSQKIDEFCDGAPPPLVASQSPEVKVVFTTDDSGIKGRGFEANYRAEDCITYGGGKSSRECPSGGYYLDESCGIFMAPNYPHDTEKSCYWRIEVALGSYVELEFVEWKLDGDVQVDIYDSYSDENNALLIGSFNRDKPPPEKIVSSFNHLYVVLQTGSDSGSSKGFLAKYFSKYFSANQVPKNATKSEEGYECKDEGYSQYNKYCYKLVAESKSLTWASAEERCVADGSHLVSLLNGEETGYIYDQVTASWSQEINGNEELQFYIGLRDKDPSPAKFRWSDGNPLSFSKWAKNLPPRSELQPDGGLYEHCTAIKITNLYSFDHWHDILCGEEVINKYICKKPAAATVALASSQKITPPVTSSECDPSHFFTCNDTSCILSSYKCDGQIDCFDGSDEVLCDENQHTNNNTFICDNENSISLSLYCDHVDNCGDNSDEANCIYGDCSVNQFGCDNGQCIGEEERCDLSADCMDGSDEQNCEAECKLNSCISGECIPSSALCDGFIDCFYDSQDENVKNCAVEVCKWGEIECESGQCVEGSNRCIYDFDSHGYPSGCRDHSHLLSCGDFECTDEMFKCGGDSYCIPLSRRCNGIVDCPYATDEEECGAEYACPGNYKCHGQTYCIPMSKFSDGIKDCPEGDDEKIYDVHCPEGCTCSVLSIDCTANYLAGIPQNITSQTRDLVLKENFVNVTSSVMDKFNLLGYLDLSFNAILNLDKDAFKNLKNLFFLNLTGNQLNDIEMAGMDRLQYLNISKNLISELGGQQFYTMNKLKTLDISYNEIKNIYDDAFEGLTDLEKLNLEGNLFEVESRAIFKPLVNLKELHTSSFEYCCIAGEYIDDLHCTPEKNIFSSCEDLMANSSQMVMLWVIGTAGFLGNIFVLVWRLMETAKNKVNSFLIWCLAFSDFLLSIYLLIIAIADQYYRGDYIIHDREWRSSITCKFAGILSTISSEISVFVVTLLTIDRFLVIVFPFGTRRLTLKKAYAIVAVGIVAILVLAILPVTRIPYFGDQFYGRSSVCLALHLTNQDYPGWEYSVAIFIGFNFLAFCVVFGLYINIYCSVRQSQRAVNIRGNKSETTLAIRMTWIILTDFLCWMPTCIMGMLALSGVPISGDVYAWTAVFVLPLNSALNPFIYTIGLLSSDEVRRKYYKNWKSKTDYSSSTVSNTAKTGLNGKASPPSISKLAMTKEEREKRGSIPSISSSGVYDGSPDWNTGELTKF